MPFLLNAAVAAAVKEFCLIFMFGHFLMGLHSVDVMLPFIAFQAFPALQQVLGFAALCCPLLKQMHQEQSLNLSCKPFVTATAERSQTHPL